MQVAALGMDPEEEPRGLYCGCHMFITIFGALACGLAAGQGAAWHVYGWAALGGLQLVGPIIYRSLPEDSSVAWQRRVRAVQTYCSRVLAGDADARHPNGQRYCRPFSPNELDRGNTLPQVQELFHGRPLELLSTEPKPDHTQLSADALIERIETAISQNQRVLLFVNGRNELLPIDCTLRVDGTPIALLLSRQQQQIHESHLQIYQNTVVICPPDPAAPEAPPAPLLAVQGAI
jgi:hypothetical protein